MSKMRAQHQPRLLDLLFQQSSRFSILLVVKAVDQLMELMESSLPGKTFDDHLRKMLGVAKGMRLQIPELLSFLESYLIRVQSHTRG